MRIEARPGPAPVQHVQQHATAAPHICFDTERVSSGHFGGHVGLSAGEDASYSNTNSKRTDIYFSICLEGSHGLVEIIHCIYKFDKEHASVQIVCLKTSQNSLLCRGLTHP